MIALLDLALAPRAWAQAGEQGSITGTLTDPQGAALPGVTATAVNLATNVKTTAVTNTAGVYRLPVGQRELPCDLHVDRVQHAARESSCVPATGCAWTSGSPWECDRGDQRGGLDAAPRDDDGDAQPGH